MKLKPISPKTKWIALFVISMMIPVLLLSYFSLAGTGGFSRGVISLSHWLQSYKTLFLLCHIAVIVAIYYGWEKRVAVMAEKDDWPCERVKLVSRYRYLLIAGILLVDLINGLL